MWYLLSFGLILFLAAMAAGLGLAWELLKQNGRMLLRLEALEKRLKELNAENGKHKAEIHQPLATSIPPRDEDDHLDRFSNRSLANSKIKRDGLKAGAVAPEFRLPRLDAGQLSLSELRGRLVLLVFSSPHCNPCNILAPKLQKFHRKHCELEVVVISRGELADNREKVKQYGLTFPVVLQKQWEVSRDYAFFGTPVAYLIDAAGVIAARPGYYRQTQTAPG